MRKPDFTYAKTKAQISCAVTAQLISAFVFATRIVQSLYLLNPKFQASSNLLWLYNPGCVGPGRNPRRPVFSERGLYDLSCEQLLCSTACVDPTWVCAFIVRICSQLAFSGLGTIILTRTIMIMLMMKISVHVPTTRVERKHLSRVMRKPTFSMCENKDADQLRGDREADQRLCFRYIDSTIPLLSKSEISSL